MPTLTRSSVVIIYGAAGAIGSAVAGKFAQVGVELHLAGQHTDNLERLADQLRPLSPAPIHSDQVDAYDEAAVDSHMQQVLARSQHIDVVINAVSFPLVQGVPLIDMTLDDALAPTTHWLHTQLLTARTAARQMVAQGGGTILMLSASPAKVALAGVGGFAAACSAVEAITRTLAAEVGPSGVRVVCLRPQRILDTLGTVPDLPMPVEEFTTFLTSLTTSRSLPTLADVADTAVFLADGGAQAMNGAVVNLTCGMSSD